jgi:hypothetical protein
MSFVLLSGRSGESILVPFQENSRGDFTTMPSEQPPAPDISNVTSHHTVCFFVSIPGKILQPVPLLQVEPSRRCVDWVRNTLLVLRSSIPTILSPEMLQLLSGFFIPG